MYDSFTALLNTPTKRRVAERLAEIEASDRERCSQCGGEDCICCPIYIDRQQWQDPEEFFGSNNWDDWYDESYINWVYDEDEILTLPLAELCPDGYTNRWKLFDAITEWIRKDIGEPEAEFEYDYIITNHNYVEISNIFYVYN